MRAIASFILRGRSQAVLVAAVAAVLSLLLPPLSHVAGASIALVTLRQGLREGALVVAVAVAVLAVIGYLSSLALPLVQVFLLATGLGIWVPALICAQVLKTWRSLGYALVVAGIIGALGVAVTFLVMGDVAGWWRAMVVNVLDPVLRSANTGLDSAEVDAVIADIAKVMSGIMMAALVLTTMINLYLARWAQALLFNPGGFRQEFHAMRLGREVGMVAALFLLVTTLASGTFGLFCLNLSLVWAAIYAMQGLAVVHAVVEKTRAHAAWLITTYVLMLFALPQMVLVLSGLGFADSWIDFRSRIKKKKQIHENNE